MRVRERVWVVRGRESTESESEREEAREYDHLERDRERDRESKKVWRKRVRRYGGMERVWRKIE